VGPQTRHILHITFLLSRRATRNIDEQNVVEIVHKALPEVGLPHQLRQLRHVGRNARRLIFAEQVADPISLSCALLLLSPNGLSGRKAMEWLKQKTSIAGVQVSNWMIVLGAIIIVLLISQNFY